MREKKNIVTYWKEQQSKIEENENVFQKLLHQNAKPNPSGYT
jgi:hypothetical protein